jgi:hypothetical protein
VFGKRNAVSDKNSIGGKGIKIVAAVDLRRSFLPPIIRCYRLRRILRDNGIQAVCSEVCDFGSFVAGFFVE